LSISIASQRMQPIPGQVQRRRVFAPVQQDQHPTQPGGELRINPAGVVTGEQPLKSLVQEPLDYRQT